MNEKVENYQPYDDEVIDYKRLFEETPTPYLILRPDLTIIAVNNSYLEVTNTKRSDILNQSCFKVFPADPNDLEASGPRTLRSSLKRVVEEKVQDFMGVVKYNIPDTSSKNAPFLERYWRAVNIPVLNNSGELEYIIHRAEDVTSFIQIQKQASTAELANFKLKELQVFLETVLDNIPNMIFVKDAKSLKFLRFNKAGEELLGYSKDELVGKNDYDFFPKAEADYFTAKDRSVFEDGKILDIPEEPIHTKFQGKRILHTKKIPIYDENHNDLYLVGISEDITDKIELNNARLAKQAAEELAKRKIKFLDIAAHELRTPITSLSLMIQIAQKQIEKGKPFTADLLSKLKEPADRLSRLIIDLLDMSRLERGLVILLYKKIDIVNLISKCVEEFRLLAPNRNFIFDQPDHPIEVNLDSVRINQVLSNLFDNAVKYTADCDIRVEVKENEDSVSVSVIDKGEGITKDHQKMLFSAFSRGDSDATIKASGLGLGLSVSYGIVKLHGGVMNVESEVGKGSKFTFEIPKRGGEI